jgi:hypothetical protein
MSDEYCRRQIFPLRLSPSLRHQANDLAHREGISLNHFVSLAIAEKITRMEQGFWMREAANPKQVSFNSHRFISTREN